MKTNQVMIRKLGVFDVQQRTKDCFFCASGLMKQWCETTASKKNINHYLDLTSTKEFFQAIIDDDELIRNSEKPMNQVFVRTKAKTDSKGKKIAGEVWMNPIAFVDFAMWLNPSFKVQVIKFVYDQMIAYRNDAGDAYKELASAVSTIVKKSDVSTAMSNISIGVNHVIFGEHYPMIRNQHGNEKKMRELFSFERKVADLISEGFLKNFDEVMAYLRKTWQNKHTPKLFAE